MKIGDIIVFGVLTSHDAFPIKARIFEVEEQRELQPVMFK